MIFLPFYSIQGGGTWVPIGACVWDGHPCLRKIARLQPHYGGLHHFFRRTLNLKEGSVDTLVAEASMISAGDSLSYIASILIALSASIRSGLTGGALSDIKRLSTARIFPVDSRGDINSFDSLQSAGSKDFWLIADRPHLRKCFGGRVSLLAFDPKDIGLMSDLFAHFTMNYRLLSSVASGLALVEGSSSLHPKYTNNLRSKAYLLARYV